MNRDIDEDDRGVAERSLGQMNASQGSVIFAKANPAWLLTRVSARQEPRQDWPERWLAAGNAVGWRGASRCRFIALKSSPIWSALGKKEAGGLGEPYPPFARGSGMGWVNVSKSEWKEMLQIERNACSLSPADILERLRTHNKADRTPPAFTPDTRWRERSVQEAELCIEKIDRKLATLERLKIKSAKDAVAWEEARKQLEDDIEEQIMFAREDFAAYCAAIGIYASRLRRLPLPRSPFEQERFSSIVFWHSERISSAYGDMLDEYRKLADYFKEISSLAKAARKASRCAAQA